MVVLYRGLSLVELRRGARLFQQIAVRDSADVLFEKARRTSDDCFHLMREVRLVGKSNLHGELGPVDVLRSRDGHSRGAHPPGAPKLFGSQTNRALKAALELPCADPGRCRNFADLQGSAASCNRARPVRNFLVNLTGRPVQGTKCARICIHRSIKAGGQIQARPDAICQLQTHVGGFERFIA